MRDFRILSCFYETSFPPSHAQPTGLPPTIAAVIIESDCQKKHQTRDSSKHVSQATVVDQVNPTAHGTSSPLFKTLWFPNPLLRKKIGKNRNCSDTSPPFDPFKNPREPFKKNQHFPPQLTGADWAGSRPPRAAPPCCPEGVHVLAIHCDLRQNPAGDLRNIHRVLWIMSHMFERKNPWMFHIYIYILYMYVCMCMYIYRCVCMHACMHPCMHVCMRIYIYIYMYVCVCMHACMYVCVYIYIYMYVCMCVCMHACMYVCVYICVCMYVCMHVCMHAWMDGWIYGCMYACMHACMHAWMDGCMYVCIIMCMILCMYKKRERENGTSNKQKPSLASRQADCSTASLAGRLSASSKNVGYCSCPQTLGLVFNCFGMVWLF